MDHGLQIMSKNKKIESSDARGEIERISFAKVSDDVHEEDIGGWSLTTRPGIQESKEFVVGSMDDVYVDFGSERIRLVPALADKSEELQQLRVRMDEMERTEELQQLRVRMDEMERTAELSRVRMDEMERTAELSRVKTDDMARFVEVGRSAVYRSFIEELGKKLWKQYGKRDDSTTATARPNSSKTWKSFYTTVVPITILTSDAVKFLTARGSYSTISCSKIHCKRSKGDYMDAIKGLTCSAAIKDNLLGLVDFVHT